MPVISASELIEQRARAVAAKLSLPHMGFVLSRARLHRLVEPVRSGGVISLVAGPGCGKTALIVDLLSSTSGRTVYFSLDESDRDPVRFLSYLMAGLGAQPLEATDDRSLLWSAPGQLDATVLDLTAETVDFISTLAGQSTLVAIDDIHLVESSPQVMTVLELIIKGLPPGWTVLLSSRRPLPLELDSVSLGGRIVRLQSRELRLTPREVAAWAARNWSVVLQPAEARALWRLTQGWPAALVLLGQRLLSGGGRIDRRAVVEIIMRGRDLRTYLERDILSGLEEDVAQTMLTAALLPRVLFPRDEVFLPGPPGCAEAILSNLVAQGFLVTRVGSRGYTVHPLVRAFAERRARESSETAGLIGSAARHLEGIGAHRQAAALYLRAGQYREAGRPLRRLALSSLDAGVNFTSEEWLDLIPEGTSADDTEGPWLLVTKARILQEQGRYAQAATVYERAARSLAATGDKEGLLPVLLGSAFCLLNQGLRDESLAVMKRCRSLARTPHERVEVLVMEGGILVGLCRWDEAVEDLERALVLAPAGERAALVQRIHIHRARLFYSLGHYRVAKTWVERALEGSGATVGRALALNGSALLACLMGEYQDAARLADECERLVRTRGYVVAGIPCMLSQASVALGRWEWRRAVVMIREAQRLAARAGDEEEFFWAESTLGDLCRRHSNPQRALEHHRAALEIVDRSRLAVFERLNAMAAIGMDLAVLGRDSEARASLEETIRAARRWGLKGALAPALFYLGWFHARAGHECDASRALGEAMRIAEEHGHLHFFSQEAKVAMPVLALCDRFGAGAFVRDRIVPMLPDKLRAQFHDLAKGRVYPTDLPLGPVRHLAAKAPVSLPTADEQAIRSSVERIESLTDRQLEILKMIALGMPNKQIGANLYITEKTVKTHANNIFRRLGVNSRLQATLLFQGYQRAHVGRPAGRSERR